MGPREACLGPRPPGPSIDETLRAAPPGGLRREHLEQMQHWLERQPHLPPMHDEELVPFLHRANYSVERAKRGVEAFFTLRTHAPDVFGDRDPRLPAARAARQYFHVAVLPRRDPEGCPVVVLGFQPRDDLSAFDATRAANACGSLIEVVAMHHPTERAIVCVLDANNMRLTHLTRASLRLLATLLAFVQQAVPLPLKAIHVVHVHAVVEKTMTLLRPFLGKELQRLLNFHAGSMESFYAVLPKEGLPKELGGPDGSVTDLHRDLEAQLEAHGDWVMSLAARVVDEARRPGGGAPPVYGAQGSFRSLQVD